MVQRYGTVAYDWDTPEGTRYLRPFEGILGPNRNCQVRFQTSASSPTNPFRPQNTSTQQGDEYRSDPDP